MPSRGQAKLPTLKRLAAHQMPKASCTSSLMRVARALADTVGFYSSSVASISPAATREQVFIVMIACWAQKEERHIAKKSGVARLAAKVAGKSCPGDLPTWVT